MSVHILHVNQQAVAFHGDPQAMLAEVGARLGLRAPVLEGELEGYFLDFGVVTGKT